MKKLIITFSICISFLALTGCSKTELEYFNLLEKTLDIKSYSSESYTEFDLIGDIPEKVKCDIAPMYLPSILNAIDDVKISSETDYYDSNARQSLWISTDTSSFGIHAFTNDDGSVTYQIPTLAKAYLPEQYANAEYTTLNVAEIGEMSSKISSEAIMTGGKLTSTDSKQLTKATYSFLKNYFSKAQNLPDTVTKSGKTYTLTITDEHFKALTAAFVETYIKDKSAREDLEKYADELINFYELIYGKEFAENMRVSTDKFFGNTNEIQLALDAAELISDINKTMSLGKDGIVIKSKVGSGGYIENTEYNINMIFNMEEIINSEYENPFTIELKLTSATSISNINKLKKFDIPKVDDSRTISLIKWIDSYNTDIYYEDPYFDEDYYGDDFFENLTLPAADGSITLIDDSYKVDLGSGKLINIDGTIYAPMEFIEDYIGSWAENYGTITIDLYRGGQINGLVGSDTFVSNSYKLILSKPAVKIDGKTYLPLRSLVETFLGRSLEWNGEKNCVIMRWNY